MAALLLMPLAYYLLFVYFSRALLIQIGLALVVFSLRHFELPKFIAIIGIVSLVAIATDAFLGGRLSDVLAEVWAGPTNEYQSGTGSLGIRLNGIKFYAEVFQSTSYVGIGLLSPLRAVDTAFAAGMNEHGYNPADLGIFAVVFQFGFPALAVTIHVMARLLSDLRRVSRMAQQREKVLAEALSIYILVRIVGLNHTFFWGPNALEWGLIFFFVARLCTALPVKQHLATQRLA